VALHTADLGALSVQGRTMALDTADYSSWVMTPSMEDCYEGMLLRQ